eukprot:TRINITY_DN3384_c2_g1_i2.p1 TRINITY_DN3384_c2_g1~~TRINITY_DN3384_c2_g1_i2.p1  ORF type:complete len:434 (+),score=67.45 TRINITY_DN3384_c2_g1_i2:154-1455(+)
MFLHEAMPEAEASPCAVARQGTRTRQFLAIEMLNSARFLGCSRSINGCTEFVEAEQIEALSYYFHVAKGLACAKVTGADELLPEEFLVEFGELPHSQLSDTIAWCESRSSNATTDSTHSQLRIYSAATETASATAATISTTFRNYQQFRSPDLLTHARTEKSKLMTNMGRWIELRSTSQRLWESYLNGQRLLRSMDTPLLGIPERSAHVAVLIEMRQHQNLNVIVRKTMQEIEVGKWALLLICGRGNESFLRSLVDGWQFVHVHCLDVIDMDGLAYANYRRSQELVRAIEAVGGEIALFFECDSIVLRSGIEAFLQFDLVGAPWSWAVIEEDPVSVGNGGLSLRRLSFVKRALELMGASFSGEVSVPWPKRNEDICFARAAMKMGAKTPTPSLAAAFSVETIFNPSPMGCHKPWQYLLPSDLRRILGLWEIVD